MAVGAVTRGGDTNIAGMPDLAPNKPCPICRKPADAKHLPFCSDRCADVDLNRWLSGVYAVPTDEPPETGEPE
jgi:endogenous inhibitor of DNA gyrase (YacG/DUF329 family)